MRPGVVLLFVVFLFAGKSFGQERILKVCFTGDVMLDRAVAQKIDHFGIEFFSRSIDSLLSGYNFRMVNLECPLSRTDHQIEKKYCFGVDSTKVDFLNQTGITHAGIANNHINDQQAEGAFNTLRLLENNGMVPLGYNSCSPAVIQCNGIRMAIFAGMQLNVSAEERQNICVPGELHRNVKAYRSEHPGTLIVCFMHWGIEYHHYPSEDQVALARGLIDCGADAIVGHHPHVIQSIEFYQHKPIFYSLGNFVFDQHQPDTRKGIVLGISADGVGIDYRIIPFSIQNFRPVPINEREVELFEKSLLAYSKNIELKQAGRGWLLSERPEQIYRNGNDSLKISDANFCGFVSLKKLSELEGYRLRIEDTITGQYDELHLKYPVYRFDCADVDGDGNTEILAGVVKSTHFEPEADRRLFIFRIDSFQIRPLWLGSKLCQQLIDFRCVANETENCIISFEKAKNELYCVGIYKWQNFGLRLIGYKYANLDYQTALKCFEHEK